MQILRPVPTLALAVVVLGSLSTISPLTRAAHADQGNWVRLYESPVPPDQPPPPPTPPPPVPVPVAPARTSFGLVYDSARDRMIAFAGDPGPKNDVWAVSLAPGSQWELIHDGSGSAPEPRYGTSMVYDPVGDRIVVFGGYTDYSGPYDVPHHHNDVWALTLAGTPTWTQLLPSGATPSPRQDAAAIYDPIGQRMILFGGYTNAGAFVNTVHALSLSGSPAWSSFNPPAPRPSGRNVVAFGYDSQRGRMIVSGGWNSGGYQGDTWAFDPSGAGSWTQITTSTSPPARRQSYGTYDAARDRFVIHGGFNGGFLSDSWELSLAGTPQWSQVWPGGGSPSPRAGGASIYDPVRQRQLIYGGHDSFIWPKDVWARSLNSSSTWSLHHTGQPPAPAQPQPPSTGPSADGIAPGRTSFGMVLDPARDRMVVFGGDPGPRNDLYALPLAPGSSWAYLTSPAPPPFQRYGPTAVVDPVGDRLIIFGGYNEYSRRNDTWEYSFATGSWSELAVAGTLPSPRQDAAGVYDPVGHRMVIFGGYTDAGEFINEVWSLSLGGSPAWTQHTPSGTPPSGRNTVNYAHDGARNRLVLFGGYHAGADSAGADSASFLSDTWALDLATMTWTPIATTTSPSPRRQGYTAYDAARDKLILFGGFDGTLLGDVWELNLSGTPDWTLVAATGPAPTPRGGGGALYDASRQRLIIYGGYDGTSYPRDVRALSLDASPAWSIVHDGVPPHRMIRDYVAALHAGANAIYLFGGSGPYGQTNQTWRLALSPPYDWVTLDVGPVRPVARHGHRGVWDPVRGRMIVFGGYNDYFGYLDDLWAFVPGPAPYWEPLATSGPTPPGRMLGGLSYDPVGDRLLAVGGHAGDGAEFFNSVHELPLSGPQAMTWNPLTPGGTPPSPRWLYGMQYDPIRHRLILFGGVTATGRSAELWALSLSGMPQWSQPGTLGTPPSARSDHAMVYDAALDRLVVFGGFDNDNFLNDVHALSLSGPPQWSPLSPSGTPPSARDIMHGVYDPVGGRMIVHGGWGGGGYLGDTWALELSSPPVPVQASLIDYQAEAGLVRLNWFVHGGSAGQTMVERRRADDPWTELGTPFATGNDRVTYEDRAVSAGARYAYRLRVTESGGTTVTDEVEVQVPARYELELAGAAPNPATDSRVSVAFSLARRSPARLELLDIAGRQVESRDLRELEPGRHRVTFGEGRRIQPGLYLIRLTAEGRELTSKAMVLR